MANLLLQQVNLQSEQKSKQKLVFLVQTTGRVSKHFKRKILNDVLDSLSGNWRLLRACHGNVKQAQELSQRGLVHNVHVGHLDNQEIQDATSCGHWNEERGKFKISLLLNERQKETAIFLHIQRVQENDMKMVALEE